MIGPSSPTPAHRRLVIALGALLFAAPARAALTLSGFFSGPSGSVVDGGAGDAAQGIAVDASSAGGPYVYVTGRTSTDAVTVKYDKTGHEITHVVDANGGTDVTVDAAGNVFIVGGTSNNRHVLLKYNGSLQLQTSTETAASTNYTASVAVDPSGNVVVAGSAHNGTDWDFYLARYDGNLVFQSSQTFDSGGQDFADGLWIDASGNVYVSGYLGADAAVAKFSSTFTFQSSATVVAAVTGTQWSKVKGDGLGHVFVTAGNTVASVDKVIVARFDAALTPAGSATFDVGASNFQYPRDLAVTASAVYVVANRFVNASDDDMALLKYDKSLVFRSSTTFSQGTEAPAAADVDAAGTLYVAGGRDDYRTIVGCLPDEPCASTFSKTTVEAGTNATDAHASIAADAQGNLHLAWISQGGGEIHYSERTGSTWSAPEIPDFGAVNYTSLALDSQGHPRVAYQYDPDGVFYATRDNGAWTIASDILDTNGAWTSLAFTAADRPRIAYETAAGVVKYAEFDGVAWSTSTVDASGGANNGFVTLALDAAGTPHIAYAVDLGGVSYELRYAERTGATWSVSTVDSADAAGAHISIAVDGGGHTHIAYSKNGALQHATRTGSSWSLETLDDTVTLDMGTAIAIDGDGHPHIAYHASSDGSLRYARFDGTYWRFTMVESGGNAGEWPALAIDSSGTVHLAYRDTLNNLFVVADRVGNAAVGAALGAAARGRAQAPTGFAAAPGNGRVTWSWTDHATDETGYRLYGAATASGPFTLIADENVLGPNSASYTETGLTNGATYFRYVAAVNAGGAVTALGATGTPAGSLTPTSVSAVIPTTGGALTLSPVAGPDTITVPAGAFDRDVTMTLQTPARFPDAPSTGSPLTGTGLGVDITVSDGLQPRLGAPLTVGYRPSDLGNLDEKTLVLARYEPGANVWVPLVSTVDPATHRVSAVCRHFSLYQAMVMSPAADLNGAKAFPNPLRPSLGHTAMTFTRLPPGARLRIYGQRGELISDFFADDSGQAVWAGTNASGESVASGIYFVFIEGAGHKRTIRVAVER